MYEKETHTTDPAAPAAAGSTASRTSRPQPTRRSAGRKHVVRLAVRYQAAGVVIALALLCLFFSVSTSAFLTPKNLTVIVLQVSVIGIIAVPGAMLILSGYVDLSIGAVMVLTSAIFGELTSGHPDAVWLAILASIGVALACGVITGTLVALLDFSPIIVTLGALAGLRGLAELITQADTKYGFGDAFQKLGNGDLLGFPVPGWIMLALFFVGWLVWHQMPYGRRMTAIGADAGAAKALGVGIKRIPFCLYVASAGAAGLAGLILTSELDAATTSIGEGLEIQVLSAILLGAVSFVGGRGSLVGVLAGVLFVGVLRNGLVLLAISPFLTDIAIGLALVCAAGIDVLNTRLESMPIMDDDDDLEAVPA
jgi:ribose transport system permease protein